MRFGGWDRVAVFGCGVQLLSLPWDYNPPLPGPYVTMCTYRPALGAWANCVEQVILENSSNPEREFNSTIGFVNLVCEKAGGNLAHYDLNEWKGALHNATDYIQPVPEPPTTLPITYPVKLDDEHRRTMIRGVRAEFSNLDYSNDAALWIYYYFIILMLAMLVLPHIISSNWYRKIKSKFIIPTLWHTSSHGQPSFWAMGGYVPDSEEACILIGFFIVHTLALTMKYSIDHEEIMESLLEQKLQALGNRSGILSLALLPILIVFTTRSVILMKLTGFKYSTFLVLHRWIGRAIIFDAIVHSIAFYIHERMTGALDTASTQYWWVAGIVATAVSCLILIMGSGAFRRRWYETFLYTHIAMAILFFYECWRHIETFGWLGWLKCSIGLWIAERCYRLVLIWKYGICVAEVQAEYRPSINSGGDRLITLLIPKPANWHMRPSQYAFVYFLIPTIFWQSHPFTVTDAGDTLKLVMAVKGGATRTIQRVLDFKQANDTSLDLKVLLEGPYGVAPDLGQFEQVLLISGGTGVPGPLALALSALQYMEPECIHLVVVVRNWAVLDAYEDQLMAVKSANIRMDIHYTGKTENRKWQNLTEIKIGRPNINSLVREATRPAAVVCCGPPGLNDITRNIVAAAVNENKRIDYFEEYQVW